MLFDNMIGKRPDRLPKAPSVLKKGGDMVNFLVVLAVVDVNILNWFQRFSQLTQKICGRTNFFFARAFYFLAPTPYIWQTIKGVAIFGPIGLIFSILCIYFGFIIHLDILKLNRVEQAYSEIQSGPMPMNPMALHSMGERMIYLTIFFASPLILKLVSIQFVMFYFIRTVGLYFASCTPMPPSASLARQLWNKLMGKLAPQEEMQPVPVKS